ncbi:MAG: YdcH family protein [Sphingomonas sp.]|uniref:YdcH family protein n=1 Tax=Sphingomonas sp. TaxID=28214 RepID=UPI001AC488AF|nr:YdcH family protein [Sphingomonas sp.]MBN8807553.1 YdcH family protein [Sphingomonas sp.]
MQNPHLSALETKHNVLDQQIVAESHRPLPDSQLLADLKKQKLRVKEAIAAL